jgi:hypothetical protein
MKSVPKNNLVWDIVKNYYEIGIKNSHNQKYYILMHATS